MTHLAIVLVIVLIVFGPGKLPDVFRKAGEGIKAFKDASEGKGSRADKDTTTAQIEQDEDDYEEVVVRRKKKPAQIADKDEMDDDGEVGEKVSSAPKSRKA